MEANASSPFAPASFGLGASASPPMSGASSSVAAAASTAFADVVEEQFASRIAPCLPGATVYVDDAMADIWNHSLPGGGLTRFLLAAGAVRVCRIAPSSLSAPAESADGDVPATDDKVFLISQHAGRYLDAMAATVRASATRRVSVFSCTPFRLVDETSAARWRSIPAAPREIISNELAQSMLASGAWTLGARPAEDDIALEYLPISWAALLPNVFVVPGSPEPTLAPAAHRTVHLGSSLSAAPAPNALARQLAVSLFALTESRDMSPHLWTLGPAGANVARQLHTIRSHLNVTDEPGHGHVAVVVVDRDMDLLPLFTTEDHILSRIYRRCAPPLVATPPPPPSSSSTSMGLSASLTHLLPADASSTEVSLAISTDSVVEQWVQLLADLPKDGLSLLRKKVMDLGGKARVLGRPTAAQFTKLLAALHENPLAKAIIADHYDALLLVGLIVEAMADDHAADLQKVKGVQDQLQQAVLPSQSMSPGDAVAALLAPLTAAADGEAHRTKAYLPGLSLYAVVAALRIAPDVAREVIDAVAPLLASSLDDHAGGLHADALASRLHAWTAHLPPQVSDLMRGSLYGVVHNPDMFDRPPSEQPGKAGLFGLGRLLAAIPTIPVECDEILVVVTGAVTWPEVTAFREAAKECVASFGKPMTLVATGIDGPTRLVVE
ncbi:hypothetical protein H9P43_004531 [Blastocladiella emersonii ATCC 22665]|nr:hypothetical protein H9P43_004531 [Blastocladiella emersonii ATCC 22665]